MLGSAALRDILGWVTLRIVSLLRFSLPFVSFALCVVRWCPPTPPDLTSSLFLLPQTKPPLPSWPYTYPQPSNQPTSQPARRPASQQAASQPSSQSQFFLPFAALASKETNKMVDHRGPLGTVRILMGSMGSNLGLERPGTHPGSWRMSPRFGRNQCHFTMRFE